MSIDGERKGNLDGAYFIGSKRGNSSYFWQQEKKRTIPTIDNGNLENGDGSLTRERKVYQYDGHACRGVTEARAHVTSRDELVQRKAL